MFNFPQIGLGFGTQLVQPSLPDEVVPTGNRGKVKSNLKDLIAACETFQDAIGAVGTEPEKIAQAKLRIHIAAYAEENLARPFALISSVGNDKSDFDAVSQYTFGGDVELRFERVIPTEYKDEPDNAEADFENFYEGVMADAEALSILPGYFVINSWEVTEGPTQYEVAENTYVYGIKILINWGLE